MGLDERLDELERRLTEIESEWARPEIAADAAQRRALGREQAQIEPIPDVQQLAADVEARSASGGPDTPIS